MSPWNLSRGVRLKMKEINVLILSAGRRVELIQCFKRASNELSIQSNIIAVDSSSLSPALYIADRFYIIPKIDDISYLSKLIEICKYEKISIIIPTIDPELPFLAINKDLIEMKTGSKVLISSREVIETFGSKLQAYNYFVKNNIPTTNNISLVDINNGTVSFPLFIKPNRGSSSLNAYKINNINELELYTKIIPDFILQEFIEGEEYTVDAFLDFQSNIISVVPRLRISTRSGEILKGKTIRDESIIDFVKKILIKIKPIGQITIQLFKTQTCMKIIEINPRFGGGAPMSIFAGANSPKFIYQLIMGDKINYTNDFRDNMTFLRYDQTLVLNNE